MPKFTIIYTIGLCTLFLATSINANGFAKKEVYTYKDAQGNLVFTDSKPVKSKSFKTQIIESANATGNSQTKAAPAYKNISYNNKNQSQTVRIVVKQESNSKNTANKSKTNLKRCKSYKKKFTYFSDKMKSGYKNSEYKYLESNRKKYKNLLFNNCETKTFSD